MKKTAPAYLRICSYLIDLCFSALLLTPLWIWFFRGLFGPQSGTYLLGYSLLLPFIWVIVRTVYLLFTWYFFSASPAMLLLRLSIISSGKESRISLGQVLLRLTGFLLTVLSFGAAFLPALCSQKRRSLMDYMSGTEVIRKEAKYSSG